jgi:radical SAM protein with 4Fe4S-binding SPASM domain
MIQLQLENTSTCNAKCNFCVYPAAERWGGQMSMGLYKKILDEAAGIPQITHLCITGLGEPTLDRFLAERIRYAKAKKPSLKIDFFTNGVHLTPATFRAVRDAGVTSVQVSLNAVTQEQHERIMGLKGKFDQVCKNIDYAIANCGTCRVEARAVVNWDDFTEEDGFTFYERWGVRDDGGHGQLITEGNWAGDNRTHRKFKPNESCYRALGQIYVTFDGKVTTCCFDPTGKHVWGDLSQQTIKEVYNTPAYVAFREAHSMDQADKYEICKGCTRI